MALVILDRVKETTTTAGAGTVTLLGAATGFQAFSAIGNANTTYYCIAAQTLSEWEVGIGTYTLSGTTLARTTILASSNSGSVVTFSAGTKDVFVTYPAGYSVSQADTGTAPNQVPLNQYLGTMAFQDANSVNIAGGTAVLTSSLVNSPIGTGYATGSGGAVTQGTSRTTGVTLNKPTGAITMFSAAGSVVAATFTVTNSTVAATDTIVINQSTGTNLYVLLITAVAAGSFNVTFYTTSGVATDAPVLNFAIIKAVVA